MPETTTVIDLELPSGNPAAVRVVALGGAQDVARLPSVDFQTVTSTIEEIGTALKSTMERVAPTRGKVTFGVELAVKAGALVTLLATADGKATLTVELEWGG
jgi:hypothetical protein